MKTTKTMIRLFTVADYDKEEKFLARQHKDGWRLTGFTMPCFYRFEACEPACVSYRMDFRENVKNEDEYFQMFSDYGWEHTHSCASFHCFRKAADEEDDNPDIFSDDASRLSLISRIMQRRFLPLLVIFLCCIIPNLTSALDGELNDWFLWTYVVLFVLYIIMIAHCAVSFCRLKRRYAEESRR